MDDESGHIEGLASLTEAIEAGWQYSSRIDGYGRTFNVAYNTKTKERRQWSTPATSTVCLCDICTVWQRKGREPMHPPLTSAETVPETPATP